jgi:hypothetical protein
VLLSSSTAMTDLSSLADQLSPILKGTGFVGVVTGVAKAFSWVDDGISDESRLGLTKWLKDVPGDDEIDTWASVFPNLIDRIFGERARSWKFFFRSCAASLLAVSSITLLTYLTSDRENLTAYIGTGGFLEIVAILALSANCIPDYFSLLISRSIVKLMARHPKPLPVALLLISDIVITTTVCVAALTLAFPVAIDISSLLLGIRGGPITPLGEIAFWFGHLTFHDIGEYFTDPVMRIFVLASFFTSVWVWLYVLASVAIRLLHKVRFIWVKITPILNLDKKPLQSIGRVAGLIAGMGYVALIGGMWLYKHL